MERLTNIGSNGEIWITDNDETRRNGRKESAYKKLAEYEDLEELIGIPLKDIAKISRQNIPEDCKHPRKAIVLTDDDVDRWNSYKNAEEQALARLHEFIEENNIDCVEDVYQRDSVNEQCVDLLAELVEIIIG